MLNENLLGSQIGEDEIEEQETEMELETIIPVLILVRHFARNSEVLVYYARIEFVYFLLFQLLCMYSLVTP